MNSNHWMPPERPAELTERRIISAILDGTFAVEGNLPAERELAVQLGVTRPTLREALQRLARDGWLEIRQGKPTRVRNYAAEGNLAVLAAIAQNQENLPRNFVPNLLYVRILLAPAYARLAVQNDPERIADLCSTAGTLPEDAEAFSQFDWQLHHTLTIASGNLVFPLILNGFQTLYIGMGIRYFALPETRAHSRGWYREVAKTCDTHDPDKAASVTERIMKESLAIWQKSLK